MRVCRAPARDALAAPSSFVQLLNQLFSNGKGAAGRLAPVDAESLSRPPLGAEYSTALSRPGQHLFFDRERHARSDEAGRRVVDADRNQRPDLVVDAHVTAVIQPVSVNRHRRPVPRSARRFGR